MKWGEESKWSETLNLERGHLSWMAQLVKANEAPNPKGRMLAR
jgi:hypothetical protein